MMDYGSVFERILIIGNGFDENLGYKTSYEDFIKWVQSERFNEIKDSHLYKYLSKKLSLQIGSM